MDYNLVIGLVSIALDIKMHVFVCRLGSTADTLEHPFGYPFHGTCRDRLPQLCGSRLSLRNFRMISHHLVCVHILGQDSFACVLSHV